MLKVVVLQNFATIGAPEQIAEAEEKNWSVVALSQRLIDERRLNGLQHLNTRRLDLVVYNETRFAILNLQAFKILDCPKATELISKCSSYFITPDGSLLFGVQPSGDLIVLTEGLEKVKTVRKPAFIKLQHKPHRWYESVPLLPSLLSIFIGSDNTDKNRSSNRIYPEIANPENPPVNLWWSSSAHFSEHLREKFPYLTSVSDGLAIFCAFSPVNCYIFLSSYETALRDKSIANYRGTQVPGRWYRIIMHKSFIQKWLEDKRVVPWFEANLCYKTDDNGNSSVSGAMVYGVMEGVRLELAYGIIQRKGEKFILSWEILQYEVDWALKEPGLPYNLGCRFVARFSSDCEKLAIFIGTHLGMYTHVQEVPFYPEGPMKLQRQKYSLCNHSEYDGTHFYKSECWVSDIQWLVEDAYIACMTMCGSLSIFYSSGEPMILKMRKPGAEPDEDKSARYFFPVFHPQQLSSPNPSSVTCKPEGKHRANRLQYPTIKWIDSERVLTCSSGARMELLAIQRVMNVPVHEEPEKPSSTKVVPIPIDTEPKPQVSNAAPSNLEITELEPPRKIEKEESVTLLLEPAKSIDKGDDDNYNNNNNNYNNTSVSSTDQDAKYASDSESVEAEVVVDRLPPAKDPGQELEASEQEISKNSENFLV